MNAFQLAQQQFNQVANKLKLDKPVREFLRWPMREFHFKFRCGWTMGECEKAQDPLAQQAIDLPVEE